MLNYEIRIKSKIKQKISPDPAVTSKFDFNLPDFSKKRLITFEDPLDIDKNYIQFKFQWANDTSMRTFQNILDQAIQLYHSTQSKYGLKLATPILVYYSLPISLKVILEQNLYLQNCNIIELHEYIEKLQNIQDLYSTQRSIKLLKTHKCKSMNNRTQVKTPLKERLKGQSLINGLTGFLKQPQVPEFFYT
jgi:hypothetical protein